MLRWTLSDRTWLVPEVIQTSTMDCGPAALKALLDGHRIPVSYGGLRELCRTDVDGTSITTLEEMAVALGLEAEQVMLPVENVLLNGFATLPAIAVITLANGFTHFVVIWRLHGRLVQIMDPGRGRVWMSRDRLLSELYRHRLDIDAEEWRAWAETESFCLPLRLRLIDLGLIAARAEALVRAAQASPGWRGLAALDAATRLVVRLVEQRAVERGTEADTLVQRLFDHERERHADAETLIPAAFWSTRGVEPGSETLRFEAALLVSVSGLAAEAGPVPEDLADAEKLTQLKEAVEPSPEAELWRLIRADRWLALLLAVGISVAGLGVAVEILLLRGVLQSSAEGLAWTLPAFALTIGLLLILELAATSSAHYLGRRLELRVRRALYEKVPRLGDRYFRSRLVSDMAQRAFELRILRQLPTMIGGGLRTVTGLLFVFVGITLVHPSGLALAIVTLIVAIAIAVLSGPLLEPHEARQRTYGGVLSRFYYDALIGQLPLKAHQAEPAFRTEQEELIVAWGRSGLRATTAAMALGVAGFSVNTIVVILMVRGYVSQGGSVLGTLLLLYFCLSLPALTAALANTARWYPHIRQTVMRILELLLAQEEGGLRIDDMSPKRTSGQTDDPAPAAAPGVAIELEHVTVKAAGREILQDMTLDIPSGAHVAIVGASGAGKSSLVGLLLGWHTPASGVVRADGAPLDAAGILRLRLATAWVDPQVQLWNTTLAENVAYGNRCDAESALAAVAAPSGLGALIERLGGDDVVLGEGGRLVSGGEGQRVRLARALNRRDVRLVILDEAFRGLDRGQRHDLLTHARQHWRDATLLFISHDIQDTVGFERVLVVDNARIVEDAAPAALLAQDTLYRRLLDAETRVQRQIWRAPHWRRLTLEGGGLTESPGAVQGPATS